MKARFRNKVARQRRKEGADVRKVEREKLTTDQQLDKLDRMFGVGEGADKERTRLVETQAKKHKEKLLPLEAIKKIAEQDVIVAKAVKEAKLFKAFKDVEATVLISATAPKK